MNPRWNSKEINLLKRYYPSGDKKVILNRLKGRNWDAIVQKACFFKIYSRRWSENEKEILRKRYAVEGPSKALKKYFGLPNGNALAAAAFRYGAKRNGSKREWANCYKGYGKIYGSYLSSIRKGARHRNLKCNIDIKFIWELFEKQKGKCVLTGLPLIFSENSRNFNDQTASLDRIDSHKGYTKDNVRWLHRDVNFMKQQMTDEKLIQYCKLITKNHARTF